MKEGAVLPKTLKITKEMILDTAFDIAKEEGMNQVSNREIAKRLNSSIRPIYYQFSNTEELKKELYQKIERYFYQVIMADLNDSMPQYKQIGINYIKFACDEKNLFQILFMSKGDYFLDSFVSKDAEDFFKSALYGTYFDQFIMLYYSGLINNYRTIWFNAISRSRYKCFC